MLLLLEMHELGMHPFLTENQDSRLRHALQLSISFFQIKRTYLHLCVRPDDIDTIVPEQTTESVIQISNVCAKCN